ncbi:MAG TPA: FAD-dependent oxidoreductase [Gaiellaceae bacterium]|nr:FAD-dependent oxidoreductase [Gaiellaceae bacterium]
MARTPLAQALEDAAITRTNRRNLLKGAGAALVGTTLLARPEFAGAARGTPPRIAVVGAGLAGLTCAYRLQQAGLLADVYEASSRVGGRCWTGRGDFADGQIYEHGGELIDTGHKALRQLAQELGLQLDNLIKAEKSGTEQLGYFFGKPYTYDQMGADFEKVVDQMNADTKAAGYPTQYNSYTQRGFELDHMSLYDYIERYVPGGHHSPFGAFLDVAYNIEYGAETTQQSSLNLLYLLGFQGPNDPFSTFGESDEKFHIHGGNDQVATILASKLGGQIIANTPMTAIKQRSDGTFKLSFGSTDKTYDHVVLALPFSILRTLDFSQAGFNDVKTTAINELGMGTNSKFHVQFTSRFWSDQGCNGETYSDRGYQNTWEVSRAQDGQSGLLSWYTGGEEGVAVGSGTPQSQARTFLRQIEPVLPGATAKWNGRVTRDYWTGYPWTKGSYSYWKVGQYTRFSGAEGERSGNCYFCGEHTSTDFQGYLNGAVDTGETAAKQVIRRV